MTAQRILEMIESVDPADDKKLDEIDIRTHCWLANREWGGWHKEGSTMTGSWALDDNGKRIENSYANHSTFLRLSRSRDALKSIRPEGWDFEIAPVINGNYEARLSRTWPLADTGDYDGIDVGGYQAKTEELAELHAIIQAIEYERGQK